MIELSRQDQRADGCIIPADLEAPKEILAYAETGEQRAEAVE
jgi:hypothetical protein